MKVKGFIDFLYDYTEKQIAKEDCAEVRKELLTQFTGYFYRALSPSEKQKYYADLQYLIKTYLDKTVDLEKAYTYLSDTQKQEIKQNHKRIILEAIETLEEDSNDYYLTIGRNVRTGVYSKKIIDKNNLLIEIQNWEEKYQESLDYGISQTLMNELKKNKKQKIEVES